MLIIYSLSIRSLGEVVVDQRQGSMTMYLAISILQLLLIFILKKKKIKFIGPFTKITHRNSDERKIKVLSMIIQGFWILEPPGMKRISIQLGGSLLPKYYGNMSKHWASLWVEVVQTNSTDASEKSILFNRVSGINYLVTKLSFLSNSTCGT